MKSMKTSALSVMIGIAAIGLGAIFPTISRAHCDTLDGPVVTEARVALEKGEPETLPARRTIADGIAYVEAAIAAGETAADFSFDDAPRAAATTPLAGRFASLDGHVIRDELDGLALSINRMTDQLIRVVAAEKMLDEMLALQSEFLPSFQ